MNVYILAMRWMRCQALGHMEAVLISGENVGKRRGTMLYVCPRCGEDLS